MTAPEQQLLITEEQIMNPLTEVLEKVPSQKVSPSLKQSLDNLFPEQQYEEKAIQETKKALGSLADELSSEQLKEITAEIQYLMSSWLDDFERGIFGGLTLNELLHQKGGQ